MHPMLRYFGATLALSLAASAAQAHITLAEPQAKAGSYHVAFFRVGHGCGNSATVSIRIAIPPEVASAHPQPKPGWTLSIEKAGGRVTAIQWSGRLEADQFDQFGMMLKLPPAPGRLWFPTVQRCEAGEVDWTMVPVGGQSPHDLKSPAPMLELVPGDAMPMPMDHMKM
jgi:uncharacterized protein YcnI